MRVRKPLHKSARPDLQNSEANEQEKQLKVRNPKPADLDQTSKEVLENLEELLVSGGLRILEIRKYVGQSGSREYIVWMYHDPGVVPYQGNGKTFSQAIASLLNAIRSK